MADEAILKIRTESAGFDAFTKSFCDFRYSRAIGHAEFYFRHHHLKFAVLGARLEAFADRAI
jgi:hypothetical protein